MEISISNTSKIRLRFLVVSKDKLIRNEGLKNVGIYAHLAGEYMHFPLLRLLLSRVIEPELIAWD